MADRIMTKHPQEGKRGVNIRTDKYEQIREAILAILREDSLLTFAELMNRVGKDLEGSFAGSTSWYVTTVKLDLEARGVIERIPGSKPQQLRLAPGMNKLQPPG